MSANAAPDITDQRTAPIYRAAITVMTWGFRVSAALLLIGLAIALVRQESIAHQADPFGEIIPAVLDGTAAGFIDLAIVTMMVTPLVTVVTVGLGFHRIGDRRYALCSLFVLCVLGVSVLLAIIR